MLWAAQVCILATVVFVWIAPATAQESATRPVDYVISVGDKLQLDFLDDQEGPFALIVGDDGAVQLPYLGTLALSGERLE